jgi:hypothetical protein
MKAVKKVTSLELVEAVGFEFKALVLGVYEKTVRLLISDDKYSLKTPKDFTLNEIKEGDILDVSYELHGSRVNLIIVNKTGAAV